MAQASGLFDSLQRNWKATIGWGVGVALPLFGAFMADNWWLLIWAGVPVLILEVLPWSSWRFLRGIGYRQPPIRTLWLLSALLFLVAITGLAFVPALNARNRLLGYEPFTPRNWLNLGWLNEPTYRLARPMSVGHQLVVVTIDESETGEGVRSNRRELLEFVAKAYKNDATGVALDFVFAAEDPRGDETFCDEINWRREASGGFFNVFLGYDIRTFETEAGPIVAPRAPPRTLADESMVRRGFEDGDLDPHPIWHRYKRPRKGKREMPLVAPPRGKLGFDNFGHVYVFHETSGEVRSIPLGFSGRMTQPALCVRIAEHIRRSQGRLSAPGSPTDAVDHAEPVRPLQLPPGGLLYFVPPSTPLLHLHGEDFQDLDETGELAELLRGRFVLIGSEGGADTVATPFHRADIPGVFVHAFGVEALLGEHWVVRSEWWYALLGAVLPVLSLATRMSRRRATRGIVLSTVALTLIFIAISGVIIVLSGVWIDVSYVVVAIWGFLFVGYGIRWIKSLVTARRRAVAASKIEAEPT